MRKLAVGLCVTAMSFAALGQGTINFSTYEPGGGVNAAVTLNGDRLNVDGAAYLAQLYVNDGSSFVAVGSPVEFRAGAAAGYVVPSTVTVDFVAPGASADVIMKAWAAADGASFEEAAPVGTSGASDIFNIAALGGAGSPPSLPAYMANLTGFEMTVVPEPSTLALGLLGLAAFALRRRK